MTQASFKKASLTCFQKAYGKGNHRPVSILPNISEVYEKYMQDKMNTVL